MGKSLRSGVAMSWVNLPVSCRQLTASNTAQPNKVRMPAAGHVVAVVGEPGVYTYGTIATDADVTVRKNTTVLHSAPIPVVDSSAVNTTEATLCPTLTVTEATLRFAAGDYLAAEVELTGGSTPAIDGMGAAVLVAWE